MLTGLSQRLLTLLQLTRMALVFTAIADSQAALLLSSATQTAPGESFLGRLGPGSMLTVAVISVGLYGFGMSLNDIIDRRRDRQISPNRPLPSGRVGVVAAHVICIFLGVAALAGGAAFRAYSRAGGVGGGDLSLFLVGFTLLLIVFYDLAGKYLVGLGLLTLGLVRFFHALIPAAYLTGPAGEALRIFAIPRSPYGSLRYWPMVHVAAVLHPLWLLNHVTILSTVAYAWEQKRPPLTKRHWWGVLGVLALIDVLVLAVVARHGPGSARENLRVTPGLLLPLGASAAFVVVAWQVRRTTKSWREAGQKLMLFGLLWLIIYDACFVAVYAHWLAALILLLLLPVAYLSVMLMRWWSKLLSVSQRPAFKRAGM